MKNLKKKLRSRFMKEVRMFIVTLLGVTAFLCLAGEPIDESRWLQTFFEQIGLAAAFGLTTYLLYTFWHSRGLLPEELDNEKI